MSNIWFKVFIVLQLCKKELYKYFVQYFQYLSYNCGLWAARVCLRIWEWRPRLVFVTNSNTGEYVKLLITGYIHNKSNQKSGNVLQIYHVSWNRAHNSCLVSIGTYIASNKATNSWHWADGPHVDVTVGWGSRSRPWFWWTPELKAVEELLKITSFKQDKGRI